MRILFISFSITSFGSPDLLWYLAAERALVQGHDVWVSISDWGALNSPQYSTLREKGAHVEFRGRGARAESFLLRQFDKAAHKLGRNQKRSWRRLFTAAKPDVVVINDPGICHFMSALDFSDEVLRVGVRIITICQFNSENGALRDWLRTRTFFRRTVANVFVSTRNVDVARRQLCLPFNRAVVLDNPPALSEASILPFPSGEKPRMAIVARLECGVKGQDVVLSILARQVWRRRDWDLTIAGTGPDEDYLKQLVQYYGLTDRVNFLGFCQDVRDLWRQHALLLLCSLGEGKPLALTEAMICGRPAVVTDVGGNAELIGDGVTGFIAESASYNSFAKALETAWEHKDRWRAMGITAHSSVTDRLSPPPDQRLFELITSAV